METCFQPPLEQPLTLMDVISLPSSLSSSLSPCRKVRGFHPSAHMHSPSASQVQPAPHVLHVLQVSLLDFLTAALHRLCGRCLNRRGNRTWFSVYLPLISAVHTPAVPPTAPPTPLKTVRCDSFLLPCSLSFCTKAPLSLRGFLQVNSVTAYFYKCNSS